MTASILISVFLLGIALSMDAFAVSVTDGLIYKDINVRRSIFIAAVFGVMQALMPLLGYWIIEGVTVIVGSTSGEKAGEILAISVVFLAATLLLFIGTKMLIEGIKKLKVSDEEKKELKNFSYKEVLLMGVVTAIDALAAGIELHAGSSTNQTIWLHVAIIMVCTFTISLLGVLFGNQIEKLLKGNFSICNIVGGSILILLGIWVVLSHFFPALSF